MRWLLLYVGGVLLAVLMLLYGLGQGIGGCDVCEDRGHGGWCWFCTGPGQIAYVLIATSGVWVTALLQLRSRWRARRRELYGDGER